MRSYKTNKSELLISFRRIIFILISTFKINDRKPLGSNNGIGIGIENGNDPHDWLELL